MSTTPESRPGRLLDIEDRRRCQEFAHVSLDEIPLAEAKPKLLGESVWSIVKNTPSILFEGGDIVQLDEALPFLYFYPRIGFHLCRYCKQLKDPRTIEPLLREDAAYVVFEGSFAEAPIEFQKVAWKYNSLTVGRRSFNTLRQVQLFHDVVEGGSDHTTICNHCRKKVSRGLEDSKAGLLQPDRSYLAWALNTIELLPGMVAYKFLNRLEAAVQEGRHSEIAQLARSVSFTVYSGSCRSLNATPQKSDRSLRSTKLLVEALRIDMPDGLAVDEYLSMIRPHIGTLNPGLVPRREEDILATSHRINADVRQIEGSHKLAIGRVMASSVIPALASVGVAFATHGLLSHEVGEAVKSVASDERADTPSGVRFLSRYFGAPEHSIHVWRIQEKLRSGLK